MLPLVSVMIPCYNATKSLPLALASLLSQTYTNWECILVDDGSEDNPKVLIDILDDERIRFYQFETNLGRGAARQKALNMAYGDYLCMLDADDWIYPDKLERQVEIMETSPDLAIVSSAMIIADKKNNPIAYRTTASSSETPLVVYNALTYPQMPRIAHAPSILRASIVKQYSYDIQFATAEDADFLLRIMMQENFGTFSEITYVYKEVENYTLDKMLQSIQANQKMFSKYKNRFPVIVYKNQVKLFIKAQIYRIAFGIGLDSYFVRRRSQDTTEQQLNEFKKARQVVYDIGKHVFSDTPYQDIFEH